jgi:hypothetical protein
MHLEILLLRRQLTIGAREEEMLADEAVESDRVSRQLRYP